PARLRRNGATGRAAPAAGIARRGAWLAISRRPSPLRDVLLAALAPRGGNRACCAWVHESRNIGPVANPDSPGRRGNRRVRGDRGLSCRRRSEDFRGDCHLHRASARRQHRRIAEADHSRAPDPLRPSAIRVPRHFHGRVECYPVARRRRADRFPDPAGPGAMTDWRPGDRTVDTASMVRVDQAGEYGATRIYAGQLAVLRRNCPEAKLIDRMAAQEDRHLARFDRLMADRRVRPKVLQPLWNVAGFALGAATALMSEKDESAC